MMMAHEYYIFTGRAGERIPLHVTHVLIDKALKFVRARAFEWHGNIEEVICHDGVEKIEKEAFYRCRSLRRVIMPGVRDVERRAFDNCTALTYIECGKLERIGEWAFDSCTSLTSVDLPSIKTVERFAFRGCTNLTNVKFGKDLETIGTGAFYDCIDLERITLPLKDRMFTDDRTFQQCEKLNHVDLVGGVHETVAALLMDGWKNDMNEEIDSINQILPFTTAGDSLYDGEKDQAIRTWIRSVLRKIIRYKAEHRRYVNEAAATLHSSLPNDIVLKNVVPFLELPSHTFEGGE